MSQGDIFTGEFFTKEETHGTPLLAAVAANINFMGVVYHGEEIYGTPQSVKSK